MADAMGVTVTGIPEVEALFERLRAQASDLTAVMDGPASDLIEAFFLNRLANGGPDWAGLAPSTLAARRRPGRGLGGIGEDTLQMYQSFINAQADGAVKVVSPTGVSRGTQVESSRGYMYAETFHMGTKNGRQPARPLFDDEGLATLAQATEVVIRDHVLLGGA